LTDYHTGDQQQATQPAAARHGLTQPQASEEGARGRLEDTDEQPWRALPFDYFAEGSHELRTLVVRTDADAEIVVDFRGLEMAYQDGART
jgi:hypothetical protein